MVIYSPDSPLPRLRDKLRPRRTKKTIKNGLSRLIQRSESRGIALWHCSGEVFIARSVPQQRMKLVRQDQWNSPDIDISQFCHQFEITRWEARVLLNFERVDHSGQYLIAGALLFQLSLPSNHDTNSEVTRDLHIQHHDNLRGGGCVVDMLSSDNITTPDQVPAPLLRPRPANKSKQNTIKFFNDLLWRPLLNSMKVPGKGPRSEWE